jgi:hypothetical protein
VLQLEDRLREMEDGEPRRGGRSGGFLGGGYWGDRRGEEPRSSVPQVGTRATPSAYDRGGSYEDRPPFGDRRPSPQDAPQSPPPQAGPSPWGGGGFLKSALATAAGVAGGMVLADSIRGMMGGAHASPASSSPLSGPQEGGALESGQRYVDERDNDPGTRERDDTGRDDDNDPGYNDDGNDPGGDEIEI